MKDCYQIKSASYLIKFLKQNGIKDLVWESNYQVQTNFGFIYNLKDGKKVFLPNDFKNKGLIFSNAQCLKKVIASDIFPIENPHPNLYEIEIDNIRQINRKISYYIDHLAKILKLDYSGLNREYCQKCLSKIIGRYIKKITSEKDLVALIAIIGELVRKEVDGYWMLEKWYGLYNPYFIPKILNKKKKVISVNDRVLSLVKWRIAKIDFILGDIEGLLSFKQVAKYHECIVLKD